MYRASPRIDRDSQSAQPSKSLELGISGHSSAVRKFIESARSVGRVSQGKHFRYKTKLDNLPSQSGQLGIEVGIHRGRLGNLFCGPIWITCWRCGKHRDHNGPKFFLEAIACAMEFMCNHCFNIRAFQAIICLDC